MVKPATGRVPKTETLEIADRLNLLEILPPKGNIANMRVLWELQQKLGCTGEELLALGTKDAEGKDIPSAAWQFWKVKAKAIPIGPAAREIVKAKLKELDEKEDLRLAHVHLWEVFIEGKRKPRPRTEPTKKNVPSKPPPKEETENE